MKSRPLTAAACVAVLVTLVGCGDTHAPRASMPDELRAKGVDRVVADTSLDFSTLADGNRRLGYALVRHVPRSDGNVVVSPLSLSYAMAMVREGSAGKTASQMDRTLGLPSTGRGQLYNGLSGSLGRANSNLVEVRLTDGVFVDKRLPVVAGYLDTLARYYGAGVEQTTFPSPALDQINGWVDNHTSGRIPHLLDHLDPDARMALVNTLYLKARWAVPFDPDKTENGAFHATPRRSQIVHMMALTSSVPYAAGPGWQVIALPYAGGRLSMWIMLPGAGMDPATLLTSAAMASEQQAMSAQTVDIELPRWSIDTSAALKPVLEQLGMSDAFDPSRADFSKMSPERLFIATVAQQASITVGEKGTEAAAATAVVMKPGAGQVQPNPSFTADHPFAFAVVDNASGVPLFEGTVAHPTTVG